MILRSAVGDIGANYTNGSVGTTYAAVGGACEHAAMETVLVGFDGRESGHDALALGGELAQALRARLAVAHARESGGSADDPDPFGDPARREEAVAELRRATEDLLGGDRFEWRELKGSAAAALTGEAENAGATMLVIGSTHRAAPGRMLLGTTGDRLFNGAPCPVAVAPRGYAGKGHLGLGRIGVGYDGLPDARRALEEAEKLAARLGAELELIAVAPTKESAPAWLGSTEPIRDRLKNALDDARAELGEDARAETVLDEGSEPEVLAGHGVELDLLVVGSRGYGPVERVLLGSVASKLIAVAPCPVVVVPRAARR